MQMYSIPEMSPIRKNASKLATFLSKPLDKNKMILHKNSESVYDIQFFLTT